jgi:hypothetical protein
MRKHDPLQPRDQQGKFTDLTRLVEALEQVHPVIHVEDGLANQPDLAPSTDGVVATHEARPDHQEHEAEKS